MKGNRAEDYNRTIKEAYEARKNYEANDYNKLGKIAYFCVRIQEITKNDESVNISNRRALQKYFAETYEQHPCLVLKTDKVYGYTRNNVCKCVRGIYGHTHQPPRSKNAEKKYRVLWEFVNDAPTEILFCIKSQWIMTPFVKPHQNTQDSRSYMKENYTNSSGKKNEIGVIESIIFNIYDEIFHILDNGKIGWSHDKVIWPFDESYRKDFGDELFTKINDTLPFLRELNSNISK